MLRNQVVIRVVEIKLEGVCIFDPGKKHFSVDG